MMMRNRFARLAPALLGIVAPATGVGQVAVVSDPVAEQTATPAESYTGVLRLRNTAGEAYTAKIYQKDYLFHADGSNVFGSPGTDPRSNARWVSFSPDQVTIAPGQTVIVQYTVRVPDADAGLSGTYWSLLMVETLSGGAPESAEYSSRRKSQVGLRTTTRYATQIATHVNGGEIAMGFSNLVAEAARGDHPALLALDVSNTSERAVRPRMSLELYSQRGELVQKASQSRGLVYPGTSFRQAFVLGPLAPGRYKAIVLGDAGGDEIFGGQYDVTF
jgi:hypothetical protein